MTAPTGQARIVVPVSNSSAESAVRNGFEIEHGSEMLILHANLSGQAEVRALAAEL
jgi:hypothetical protein